MNAHPSSILIGRIFVYSLWGIAAPFQALAAHEDVFRSQALSVPSRQHAHPSMDRNSTVAGIQQMAAQAAAPLPFSEEELSFLDFVRNAVNPKLSNGRTVYDVRIYQAKTVTRETADQLKEKIRAWIRRGWMQEVSSSRTAVMNNTIVEVAAAGQRIATRWQKYRKSQIGHDKPFFDQEQLRETLVRVRVDLSRVFTRDQIHSSATTALVRIIGRMGKEFGLSPGQLDTRLMNLFMRGNTRLPTPIFNAYVRVLRTPSGASVVFNFLAKKIEARVALDVMYAAIRKSV